MTSQSLTLSQARRIALAAQGFGSRRTDTNTNWAGMRRVIDRLGLLQIDSVNVCVRSHYMPMFSRLGPYNCARLDDALLTQKNRDRNYFEYWGHEASFLPVAMHPLFRWRMAAAARGEDVWKQVAEFAYERPDAVQRVLDMIRDKGALATRELGEDGETGGGLWEWKQSKLALEYLFWTGQLTVAGRRGFERVYDLPERVLPSEVINAVTPSKSDAHRALITLSAHALGIATAADLRDYFRLPARNFDQCLREVVENGDIEPVCVKGWKQQAYLARDAKLPRWVRSTALLTPFDPIVWFRPRAERLFDFHYRIEIYTPVEKRHYGYYCLPFMHSGQLVARVDLKADRASSCLIAQSAHAEPGHATIEIATALQDELRRLAGWQNLAEVQVKPIGDLGKLSS